MFNLLRQPIRQMPECITSFINARVAAARLQEYIEVSIPDNLHVLGYWLDMLSSINLYGVSIVRSMIEVRLRVSSAQCS